LSTRLLRDCLDDLAGLVVRTAVLLEGRGGRRIPVSEKVLAANLLANYAALGEVGLSDIVFVLVSVFSKYEYGVDDVREAVAAACGEAGEAAGALRRGVSRDLASLRASFGSSIRRPLRRMGREEREAYARLRLLGFIRHGRRGAYVVGERQADRIMEELSRRFSSYGEAVAHGIREALRSGRLEPLRLMGNSVLDYVDIDSLSLREMLGLYRVVKGRAAKRAVAEGIAEHVRKRGVERADAARVADALVEQGVLDYRVAERLLLSEPRLAERLASSIGREQVLDLAERLAGVSPKSAAVAAARALGAGAREREALELLARLGRLGDAAGEGLDSKAMEALSTLSRALNSLVSFVSENNQAYLDLAEYEIEKIRNGRVGGSLFGLLERLEASVRAFRSGSFALGVSMLVEMLDPGEALELVNLAAASRPEFRRAARVMALRVLRRALRSTFGRRSAARRRSRYGRVEVRETLYNMARNLPEPLVYVDRVRLARLVLALDKSASMRRHAFYALVSAASFAPLVERLVIFDETPYVLPRSVVSNDSRLVEYIVSLRFSGYTDIVAGIQAAVANLSPRKLVLISDMKQTVRRREDVSELLCSLAERGWRIHVIAPSGSAATASLQERCNRLTLHEVPNARELPRVLVRVAQRN
jgi:hypothetical protein